MGYYNKYFKPLLQQLKTNLLPKLVSMPISVRTSVSQSPSSAQPQPLPQKGPQQPSASGFRWTAYGTKRKYREATKIYSQVAVGWCRDLSYWLERVLLNSDRQALLVTVTFPCATTVAESLQQSNATASKLIGLQRSGLVAFMALGHELHRVDQKLEAEALKKEAQEGGGGKGSATPDPKAKSRKRGPRALGPEEAVASNLLGHAHLHALLVLPKGAAENLELLLATSAIGADLHLDFVGGSGAPNPNASHRFQGHLSRCLRYVLKEYRLEASENLSAQLPPPSEDLPASKYYLGASPEVFVVQEPFPWDRRLASLQRAIPRLCQLPPEKIFFGSQQRLTTTTCSFRVSTKGGKLKQLFTLYQHRTGELLVLNRSATRNSWPLVLIRRNTEDPSGYEILESTFQGTYLRLVGHFLNGGCYDAEVDLLLLGRQTLKTLFLAGARQRQSVKISSS